MRTQRVTTSYEVVRALFYRAFAGGRETTKMMRIRSRTETMRTQRVTTSYEVVRALFYQAFAGALRGIVPASAGSYLCRILGTHQRVSGHSQVNFIQRLLV